MSLKQLHDERYFKTLSKAIQASLKYQQEIEARVTRQQAEAFIVEHAVKFKLSLLMQFSFKASMCEIIPADFKLYLMGS
jgi:hypothetical protein